MSTIPPIPTHLDTANLDHIQRQCLEWVQKHQFKHAEKWLERILNAHGPEATLLNTLGNICARQEKEDAALAAYQAALHLKPDYPSALNNLGNYYQRHNQPSLAQTCYEKALTIDPDCADAHFNLARLLVIGEALATAQHHLEQTLRCAPQHAAAHGLLGQLYLQTHQPQKALEHLQERLAIQPHHTDTYQALAMAYLLQGEKKTALQYYLRHIEHHKNRDSFYNIGVILSDQQRHREAIDYFKQALDIDSHHLPSLLNIGALYLKNNTIPEALRIYRHALSEALAQHDTRNTVQVQHILYALEGKTSPPSAPAPYVTELFDQYAPAYDEHLTKTLRYELPQKIVQTLTAIQYPHPQSLHILDLGCGTGLMGTACAPFAKTLVGIDLSPAMLALAEKKGVYTSLLHNAIEHALPLLDTDVCFDWIIAADVLPYIGDLHNLFSKVEKWSRSQGLFIFSTEKIENTHNNENTNFLLQKNIRYAHSKNYLIDIATRYHFAIHSIDNTILRHQYHQPVSGYIFTLIKL